MKNSKTIDTQLLCYAGNKIKRLFSSTEFFSYKVFNYLLVTLYLLMFTISNYTYYMLISTSLWSKQNIFIYAAILIFLNYLFLNIGYIIVNYTSLNYQRYLIRQLNVRDLNRSNIERDLKITSEIHNLIGTGFNASLGILVSFVALIKINYMILTLYILLIIISLFLIKKIHKKYKKIDNEKRNLKDNLIKAFNQNNIFLTLEMRKFDTQANWKIQKLTLFTRVVLNATPMVALIMLTIFQKLKIEGLYLQELQFASLIIIFSKIIDISDNLAYLFTYYSKIKVCLARLSNIKIENMNNSYSITQDYLYKIKLEDISILELEVYPIYIKALNKIKSKISYINLILLFSFIFMIIYALMRYLFDSMVLYSSLEVLISMMLLMLIFIIISDFLLKFFFQKQSEILGIELIESLSIKNKSSDSDIEVLSQDLTIIDEGISYSLTESFYAFSLAIITITIFFEKTTNHISILILIILFYLLQKNYRKYARATKLIEIKTSARLTTALTENTGKVDIYSLFSDSIISQFLNTLNNRFFMITTGLLVSFFLVVLNYTDLTSYDLGTSVALIVLVIKLSSALSYAIRYLSQLEGWGISLNRIFNKIG